MDVKSFKQIVFILLSSILVSACSMEASLDSLEEVSAPILEKMKTDADFVAGEVVTTGNGFVIKGTFGELSEKQVLSNGVQIEGVFYE